MNDFANSVIMDPEYLVLYNPMSASCVLAAALLAATQCSIMTEKITTAIPGVDQFENKLKNCRVIWLGIDPRNITGIVHTGESYYFPDGQLDIICVNQHGERIMVDPKIMEDAWSDGMKPSLLDRLAMFKHFENPLPIHVCSRFGQKTHNFQNPKLESDFGLLKYKRTTGEIKQKLTTHSHETMWVYYHLKMAQEALDNDTVWNYDLTVPNGFEEEYVADLKKVKSELTRNYRMRRVLTKKGMVSYFATAFHNFSIHLALRMLRMSNVLFINHTHSTSHPIIYSNIRDLVLDRDNYDPILIETTLTVQETVSKKNRWSNLFNNLSFMFISVNASDTMFSSEQNIERRYDKDFEPKLS